MTIEKAVRAFYPNAKPLLETRAWLREWMTANFGNVMEDTLLATSWCADDILLSKGIGDQIWGPFTMGGLGGLPFGGATALAAYLHHVPDRGAGLLVHGPHIGIGRDGVLGKVARPGQSEESSCCGALEAALRQLEAPDFVAPSPGEIDPFDLEQTFLVSRLAPFRERILASSIPLREITDVAYEVGHEMLKRILRTRPAAFRGIRLACLGGVFLNTGIDEDDWIDLRSVVVIDENSKP